MVELTELGALEQRRTALANEVSRLETLKTTLTQGTEDARLHEERVLKPIRAEHERLGREIAAQRIELAGLQDQARTAAQGHADAHAATRDAESQRERAENATRALETRAVEATRQIARADALGAQIASLTSEHAALFERVQEQQGLFAQSMENVVAAEMRADVARQEHGTITAATTAKLEHVRQREEAITGQAQALQAEREKHRQDVQYLGHKETALVERQRTLDQQRAVLSEQQERLRLRSIAADALDGDLRARVESIEQRVVEVERRMHGVVERESALAVAEAATADMRGRLQLELDAQATAVGEIEAERQRLGQLKIELDGRSDGLLKAAQELRTREQAVAVREHAAQVGG